MNGNLTAEELKAVRFYTGDVSGTDGFYSDSKAYVVLNALFFPDIDTEKARADEGKYLNPEIISDIPRLTGFFESLFSAFRKSVLPEDITTYRVERMADYSIIRKNMETVSMTSTSSAGFLNAYRDRKGIALMKFSLSAGLHCIDIVKVLPYYLKSDEAEILLPPFMPLEITENELSESEIYITDSDGRPSCISCSVKAFNADPTGKNMPLPILTCDGAEAGQRVYNALNSRRIPEMHDIELYSQWKKDLQNLLKKL